ncbi:Na(+)-translocating NADH-quinone reductase subunit C [Shewanella sp. ULN5]|jgi:Na+-transporting NADH:ubiquinone oxidoreductase subunit C|uniref:Na(+)-translocating NADH-quinone reductase subunit C n=1 Tax=Shewanella sp. ULN5 TaxID=2994678 RepID=UPI00273FB308|nr:Na(+)-translocating NADH-quinone reductase subunit C [Shewanella sp. ULN5]MDP5146887.1 Na(+)-translocating NADH-quinone reductase subunit C [Shewanella sp. ULN5]
MAFKKDSVMGTMVFIISLSLVCSFMITGTAEILKERKLVKKRDEVQQFVLKAAGVESNSSDFRELFTSRVQPKLVDLESGQFIEHENILDFDGRMAAINPETSRKPKKDTAKIKSRADQVRIFEVFDDQGELTSIVMPIYGKGLWSMIYGYLAVEPDLNTIKNIVFYEHGETPGIADFVTDPEWNALWQGKKLFDEKGKIAIKVVKGGAKAGDVHGVDGVSGATRTGVGIQKAVEFWFGVEGYQNFLHTFAKTEVK